MPRMKIDNDISQVFIGLAGGIISITKNNRITIGPDGNNQEEPRYDLGPATKANFATIVSYFERLSIHGSD